MPTYRVYVDITETRTFEVEASDRFVAAKLAEDAAKAVGSAKLEYRAMHSECISD